MTSENAEVFGAQLIHLRRQVKVQLDEDYFVLWVRGGQVEDLLLSGWAKGMKFKISVSAASSDGRLDLVCVCFFC